MIAHFADPIKKREEFSVSLRKKKKSELIMSKRKRALEESKDASGMADAEEVTEMEKKHI